MIRNIRTALCLGALAISLNVFAGHGWARVNYTNSTIFTGIVTVNGLPAENGDYIGIFVNGECRMVTPVFVQDGKAYVSAVLHGEKVETATIKYWSSQQDKIYDVDTTIKTNPSNEIDLLPIRVKSGDETAEKIVQSSDVSVFPSVTKGAVNITSNKEIRSILVYNNIGNIVLTIEGNKSNIDVSDLANGIYFISVAQSDGKVITKKIIKN